ncbi:Trifunctional enzyme subunit beta-like protein [Dinothrombium tinctorium]|uniref:acetyl-CoA C-acyltransferase n=1 Tax=Dinothrombium tinctorium TaxID=1965070 RepID=A0A3S3PPA8_9ACAR|nr:Trifunctional enzyme subunit beta-like protein [Dinothrombium tinctorium]RWS16598.1 Trifunctional enzyme subunit beta-like protein [Dinothrombium tinctorium]
MLRNVVIVDGTRTPFLRSFTAYSDLMAHQLLGHTLNATLKRVNLRKEQVEYVVAGINIQDAKISNVAREAVLTAGFDPMRTPAHTCTQACISANLAISTAADMIRVGQIDVALAGGVEYLSDPLIRYPRQTRKWFLKLNRAKTLTQRFQLISKLRPKMFVPEPPSNTEFSTGHNMGECCEIANATFKISRQDQDLFAHRSHSLAQKASQAGLLSDIEPIYVLGHRRINSDNGIRVEPLEKLAKLPPAYIKPHGTVTAANATFLTDGAASTLLMSEQKASQLELKPKAIIKDYLFVSTVPKTHLLLGPAKATFDILKRNKLKLNEIDVFEYHEAFAGQLLANIAALDSEWYTKNEIGSETDEKVGRIPMEKLNTWGGSVAIGHPFGATGSRLVNMAANRLCVEGRKRALISACAGGAHATAMIIERYED